MGLFSAKKTIVVSSTVYNMAGDEENRPNFLKSVMFGAIMNPNNRYLGESIVQSYLNGPGINQRRLFTYAVRTDYPGLPTLTTSADEVEDPEVVRPFIEVPLDPPGQALVINSLRSVYGDYAIFAERYMLENHPDETESDWVAEYNLNDHTITVQREGGVTENFDAGVYGRYKKFVVSEYYFIYPEEIGELVPGPFESGVVIGDLPDDTDYVIKSNANTGVITYAQAQNVTVTKTYSNGDPTVITVNDIITNTDFNTNLERSEKSIYNGGSGIDPATSTTVFYKSVWERRELYTDTTTVTVVKPLADGETETIETVTVGEFIRPIYDYQIDTQETVASRLASTDKMYIYEVGTGNAILDALVNDTGVGSTAEYFPIIPIRLNNTSITAPQYASLYEKSKKLYRRATKNQRLSKLIEQVEDNEDLDEIDYAYVQWGVTLNTKDKEGKKYLYTFFQNLIANQTLPSDYISTFQSTLDAYKQNIIDLDAWEYDQTDSSYPLYDTPRPVQLNIPSPKSTTLVFKTDHPDLQDFDNRISFTFIEEELVVGQAKPGAKKGQFWLENEATKTYFTYPGYRAYDPDAAYYHRKKVANFFPRFAIYWQTDVNQYKKLTVHGAVFENYIYGGKSVRIPSNEAIGDVDDSGFIVPLHYPTLVDAGLVSSTQLATANTYIVFNSYQVFKKKWYQTFLGMLFIIIAVVVAAALIAPGLVGGISGVFGTNAAVGASLGLSGTGAIVAGAVANAIAAVLISTALSAGSTALFGEKWGALIGSLLSFAITFGMGGGFSNLATLFQPSNLLALSSSLANGYKGFVQASINEMNQDLFKIGEEAEAEMKRIQGMMDDLMGNDLAFDPMSLTDAAKGNGSRAGTYLPESLDEFIQRTTLTGSDIVDMTLSVITDFSALSLTLPKT